MKAIKTILHLWASKVLTETSDFDIEECATLQFGTTPIWESFFKEMRESRGWDKVRRENDFETIQQAHFKMIDLFNAEIEIQYAKQGAAAICN
jgi:hypothetical protein